MLTFNAEKHEYRLGERVIPGITEILRSAGLLSAMPENQEAMRRGEYVHLATELDDKGDLDESTLDPAIVPYLEAWRACKREVGFEVLGIEELVCNEAMGYATKVDRRVCRGGQVWIVNQKTGGHWPWYRVQMAGELLCYQGVVLDPPTRRFAVYLSDAGKWSMEEYTDPRDMAVFRAAKTIYDWRHHAEH